MESSTLLTLTNCSTDSIAHLHPWKELEVVFSDVSFVWARLSQSQPQLSVEDVRKFRARREQAQNKVAEERRRSNRDEFMIGDAVRVRDVGKATWTQKVVVVEAVTDQDGVSRSYITETDDGVHKYGHSTYLRHLL